MKKRIVYDATKVIAILENDNSVTASADNVLIEELEFAREFLDFKGIDVSLIEQELGITFDPSQVVNPIVIDTVPDPNEPDPDIFRKASYKGFFNFSEKNYMILNIRIMHYKVIEGEVTWLPDKDFIYRLRSDNSVFVNPMDLTIVPDDTPGAFREYDFYWKLIAGDPNLGIEPIPYPVLIAQAMTLGGIRGRYNTLPPIIEE